MEGIMKTLPNENVAEIKRMIQESRTAGFTRLSGSSKAERKANFMLSLGLDEQVNPIKEERIVNRKAHIVR